MSSLRTESDRYDALTRATREVLALARRQGRDTSSWSTAKAAIMEAATQLRERAAQTSPPINPDGILPLRRIVGTSPFNSADSPEAVLVPTRDGFLLRLRPGAHPARTKFSKAHEIGHTFFYDLSKSPPERILARSSPLAARKEEGICNDFATELLLPTELLLRYCSELDALTGWEILQKTKNQFEVSAEVAARKLLSCFPACQFTIAIFVDGTHLRKWLGKKIKSPRTMEREIVEQVIRVIQSNTPEKLDELAHNGKSVVEIVCDRGVKDGVLTVWLDFSKYRESKPSGRAPGSGPPTSAAR